MGFGDLVVVVTGASAGIGAGLALELDGRGANLVLAARRGDSLREVSGACRRAEYVSVDLAKREASAEVLHFALEKFGRVDVWVNGVGRGITKSVLDLTDDDVSAMMQINVMSALYGMQSVVPYFVERGQGVVVNISSLLGHLPTSPIRSAYSASKAALNALSKTLRAELRVLGVPVRIVLVMPGAVATDFGSNCLWGGPRSQEIPNVRTLDEVVPRIADGVLAGPLDIYLGEEDLDRVLAELRLNGVRSADP